jgi:hypothetical protein
MSSGFWMQCSRCRREHVEHYDRYNGATGRKDAVVMAGWLYVPGWAMLCDTCKLDFREWLKVPPDSADRRV